MHVKDRGCEDRDWIKLAQDRDQLRAVVSTLMNFCVPYSEGVGWLGKELLVCQAVSPSATQCHSAAQHSAHQHVCPYNQTSVHTIRVKGFELLTFNNHLFV
jgi:hypothetical protein